MSFMIDALKEAKIAFEKGEIPVGAVIVLNGEIIARGHNNREELGQAISHAEIEAIIKASDKLGVWRLSDCEMYVTLEPCAMCAGAIINARIKKVYFGAYEQNTGAFGSKINLAMCGLGHEPKIIGGIDEIQCKQLLEKFFENLRK